ncbi:MULTISPECIES: helix-turn-helix domain-containing protein [Halomonadaceae]|jgi:hypothetical protein|uniref:Helix-turn-helix domain-containing protein n=1 Tax=Vreelandella sp. SM1641 TaxID=3126101 RepID=A0AAU7XX80_9GAMM|nr:helix-turn-helix domain-containing protein [Halomonas sp. KO116]AJY53009.1 regulatory protein IclR [Halomonas sp. KO116]|tara:strand:+ start:3114 stop:3395 length:282 start_codon:yes stop_codon:yes gene_type:complete
MTSLSRDTQRKYDIIRAIDHMDRPSLQDISEATGIPAGTVKRQLTSIREEFKVKILFIRDPSSPEGAMGYYSLEGWGILDPNSFREHFGDRSS